MQTGDRWRIGWCPPTTWRLRIARCLKESHCYDRVELHHQISVDKTARNAACWNAQPGANTVMVTDVGC